MYKKFATYTKHEDVLLMEEDIYHADDAEIFSAEEWEEHLQSFSSANGKDNIENADDSFVLLREFI
jgi:hypothetical protein